jgi:hypothetical protein
LSIKPKASVHAKYVGAEGGKQRKYETIYVCSNEKSLKHI